MIAEADKDGDGMVSLQEFIDVMNSVHSENKDVSEAYHLPRILTESNDHLNGSVIAHMFDNSAASSSYAMDEEESESCANEEQLIDEKTTLPEIPDTSKSKSKNRRRKSLIDWLKGAHKDNDFRCSGTEFSNEALSSSSCSVASGATTTVPERVKQRRKSSFAKTFKNGKDAFLATAKTIRKFSE